MTVIIFVFCFKMQQIFVVEKLIKGPDRYEYPCRSSHIHCAAFESKLFSSAKVGGEGGQCSSILLMEVDGCDNRPSTTVSLKRAHNI